MLHNFAKIFSTIVIAVMLLSTPAIKAELPEHNLEVGDTFLHDFSFQENNILNGTEMGNDSYSPELLEILNEKEVETTVHSIVPLTSTYEVNFTHQKGDLKVLGSSNLDNWKDAYISSFYVILFVLIGTPNAGSFDRPLIDRGDDPITESFMPLFATNDENTYLDFVQNLNEDKEDLENSTANPPTGAEVMNSTVSFDSNVNTANKEFSLNIYISYSDRNTTENWRRSVNFQLDLIIDYNRSIVSFMDYRLTLEIHYEDAEQIFIQNISAKPVSKGGFIENIREQITLTQAFIVLIPTFFIMVTIRKKTHKQKQG